MLSGTCRNTPSMAVTTSSTLMRSGSHAGTKPTHSPPVAAIPPTVGSTRTFQVCSSTSCNSFVDVAATAKYVGPKGAIYLDDTVPTGGYTQADIDSVGLGNVDVRLRDTFGDGYGLVVETAPGAGTKVIVRVPKFAPGVHP